MNPHQHRAPSSFDATNSVGGNRHASVNEFATSSTALSAKQHFAAAATAMAQLYRLHGESYARGRISAARNVKCFSRVAARRASDFNPNDMVIPVSTLTVYLEAIAREFGQPLEVPPPPATGQEQDGDAPSRDAAVSRSTAPAMPPTGDRPGSSSVGSASSASAAIIVAHHPSIGISGGGTDDGLLLGSVLRNETLTYPGAADDMGSSSPHDNRPLRAHNNNETPAAATAAAAPGERCPLGAAANGGTTLLRARDNMVHSVATTEAATIRGRHPAAGGTREHSGTSASRARSSSGHDPQHRRRSTSGGGSRAGLAGPALVGPPPPALLTGTIVVRQMADVPHNFGRKRDRDAD